MSHLKNLKPGSVVQLSPESNFPGCFMMVTEVKLWGAQGFIAMPQELGKPPSSAYYRARWDQMEYVGESTWVPPEVDEDRANAESQTSKE